MKAPSLRRILESDMRELGEPGRVLLQAVNPLQDTVTSALSRGLTLRDNLRCQLQAVEFQVPAVEIEFLGTWGNFGSGWANVTLTRDATGDAVMDGLAANSAPGTYPPASTVFVAPVGYRPAGYRMRPSSSSSGTHAEIRIYENGNVDVDTGDAGYVSMSARWRPTGLPEPWASGVLFSSQLIGPATHVICAGLYNLTDKAEVSSCVTPGWRNATRDSRPHIQILDWPGLPEGKSYRAQMIAFAEGS